MSIAVLIPIYGETEKLLKQNIKVFTSLDYTSNAKVFWLINLHDTETINIIRTLQCAEFKNGLPTVLDTYPEIKILYDDLNPSMKGAALQNAVDVIKPDVVAVFDVDAVPQRDFMLKSLPKLEGKDVGAVQGLRKTYNEDENWLTKIQAYEYKGCLEGEKCTEGIFGSCWLHGSGFLIKRDVLDEVGGFRAVLTEDSDLSIRLFLNNKKIVLSDAEFYEEAPTSLANYIGQRIRWATGHFMEVEKFKGVRLPRIAKDFSTRMYAISHILETVFVFSIMFGCIYAIFYLPSLYKLLGSFFLLCNFYVEWSRHLWIIHEMKGMKNKLSYFLWVFFGYKALFSLIYIISYLKLKLRPSAWYHTKKKGIKNLWAFLKKIF